MSLALKCAYENIAARVAGVDGIIRSGELFEALRLCGVTPLHRDTFHASIGIGRYALGLIWYRALFGKAVSKNTFSDFDEQIPDSTVQVIKGITDAFY